MEDFTKLVSILLHSSTQVHIFHLQTNSYSEHKALNKYYDEIVELTDGLIETYQGKYGILKNYSNLPLKNYVDNVQLLEYFNQLDRLIEIVRLEFKDSYIQNQIDTVVELIQSTKYKLRFLS